MLRKDFCFLLFAFCFLFSACRRLPDVQGKGAVLLQGVWIQDTVPLAEQLLSNTLHKFKITCDSFYVDLTTYSKVNYYSDSCFQNGIWKEYAKGVYVMRSDSIFFEGTYTYANYKQKLSGCYHIGRYIKSFKLKKASASKLLLESTDNQRELTLKLTEKIICVPKEL